MKYITLMNPLIWLQLQYFNTKEDWGDYNKMDVRLLWNLDKVREDLARRINVNCGYELEGHAKKSFHKLGMAVDFYVENTLPYELYDLYTYFLTVWHGGVGVYPFWKLCPGFHLDVGWSDRTWARDKDGNYHYDNDKIKEVIESIYEYK